MRILIADHDASMIAATARALRNDCAVEVATSKAHCIDLLRRNEFQLVIACEHLADGSGLELLTQIAQRSPGTLRVFAAEMYRLSTLGVRLKPFDLFETLTYPLAPGQIRVLLALATEAEEAEEVDTIEAEQLSIAEDTVSEPAPPRDPAIERRASSDIVVVQRVVLRERAAETPDTPHIVLEGDKPPAANAGSSPSAPPLPLALEEDVKREPAGKVLQLPYRRPPVSPRNTAPREPSSSSFVAAAAVSQRHIIVLTRDKNCLVTIVAALAGHSLSVTSMSDLQNALKILGTGEVAAMLIDFGAVGNDPLRFLTQACAAANGTRVLALGRADDAPKLAELLSRGKLHRFVAKPVSRASMRTAFESVLALPPAESTKPSSTFSPFSALIDRVTAADLRDPPPPPQKEERTRPQFRIKRSHIQLVGSAIAAIGAIVLLVRTLSG